MPGQRIDWRRAKHPKYDTAPIIEISAHDAHADQEFLEKRAAQKKKRTKYIRATPRELAVLRLMDGPETPDERRLRAVLANISRGKGLFKLTHSSDASHRVFERRDVRIRVRIHLTAVRDLVVISPSAPTTYDWVTVGVAAAALEPSKLNFLAGMLRDLIVQQNRLRQRSNV